MNPLSPTTENEPLAKRRSVAAAVLGAILVVFSLFGLWIGIALTQPGGFVDFSTAGHVLVAVAILVGAAGVWLVASGMATPTAGTTPAPSPTPEVAQSGGRSSNMRAGTDSNPAAETSPSTDSDDRARDAAGGTITRGAADGGRWVLSALLGLVILIGMIVWHASTTPPSMADRVQRATHTKDVTCYTQGEINMGDGTTHPFYDCISWPPTSTDGPTTVGCYVYYHGRPQDISSRLARDPNSWDTWNLAFAPPSGDPQGGNVCGSYTW